MWQWCICGASSSPSPPPAKQEPTLAASLQPVDTRLLAVVAAFAGGSQNVLQTKDDIVLNLNSQEVAALRELETAGRRCLAELSDETLASIKAANSSMAASRLTGAARNASTTPPTETKMESKEQEEEEPEEENVAGFDRACVKRMFDEFDSDGDGLINLKDFEQVLDKLGAAQICGADQVPVLAKMADANQDGFIDLKEFSAWLKSFSQQASGMSSQAEDTDTKKEDVKEFLDFENQMARLRMTLRKANTRANAAEAQLSEADSEHALELRRIEDKFSKAETNLEEQATASLQFWRMVAGTSSSATLSKAIEISALEVIGSGRYSFVMKSKRVSNKKVVVAKLLSLRWVHVAANEWYVSQIIGEHPNILRAELEDVWLHADEESRVAKVIMTAIQDGILPPRNLSKLPTHYLGLLYEFMNFGTVQQWMDQERLSPEGLLSVMQQTANALAHMHAHGLSHNDVKPQNLFVSQDDENSNIVVKLADLGLGAKSSDHSKDISQFVMTVFCMATGEQFGKYKLSALMTSNGQLQPSFLSTLIASLEQLTNVSTLNFPCAAVAAEGNGVGPKRVDMALADLPRLVRCLSDGTMTMTEVRDSPLLQGWSLSDADNED